MIITTIEELRLYFPAHAFDRIDDLVGFIDNSEHDFLLQPLGLPLYEKLCEWYKQNKNAISTINDKDTSYYNRLLLMAQRCVAFDAMGRIVGVQGISMNNSGINMSIADDYPKADQDAVNRFRDTCVKEAHAALNRLLYTLEQWTATCPDAEDVTEETQDFLEIVNFWRSSRYFYLAAQLFIPSAVVLQEYLNIYDSREKFIQMLPDLHFIQEEQIAQAIGEDFCEVLAALQVSGGTKRDANAATSSAPQSLADDADMPAILRRLLHKLRKIMATLLEGRTTVIKVDKQRKIDAHDEGVRLLGQFCAYCRQHQADILTALGDNADAYRHTPLYIEPQPEPVTDASPSGCKCSDFNSPDMALHVTMPLL